MDGEAGLYKLLVDTNGFFMTNEEQFRQAIRQLDLPKVQMEAIFDLHSAIYEGVDWKGLYNRLSNLETYYPKISKAIKVGGAALIGGSPGASIYNTDWHDMAQKLGLDDKQLEQYAELPERTFDEKDTTFEYKDSPAKFDTVPTVKKDTNDRSLVRDAMSVSFPESSASEPSDNAVRKFISTNLAEAYKVKHTPEQQAAHIERILRAVHNTAQITSSRGIGEAELLALICIESMFNDKPQTTRYRGLAQLGSDAIRDARLHAGEFGLSASKMRNPEVVEDAINLAAGYLLYLMYDTERSNKVNANEKDDDHLGDMTFVFACYNGGIGTTPSPFQNDKELSVPMLYRMVDRGEITANDAVNIRASMKEALSYPTKIFKVLDYLKSIGMPTHFDSNDITYLKR